jgi:hypothetical protein
LKGHWIPAADKPISLDGQQSSLEKPSDILSANARFDDDDNIDRIDATFLDGRKLILGYDTKNTHLYDELDFSKGPDGKVTAAQITLDPDVLAAGMSIGQIFGSAIGASLGGNSLVGHLVRGAVGGLIGQKFVQALAISMTSDLSKISLNDVFASQGVSVANAGIGVISSFLTAELGHALHLNGFDGQLFNTAVSGFTTSMLTQVTSKMASDGLTFAGAIAAMDWGNAVSGALGTAGFSIESLLGSYLGHELVPAKTHEGAVGGQLLGAIGSFILPGLGSLIGTVLGTWIGNQFGTEPSPGAVDLLDQAGRLYGYAPYQHSDGGSYEPSDKMAKAAADIVNTYLHAVDGVVLDHSKQVTVGYIKNPNLLFISGTPGHTDRSFISADDAVHAAALDVLQNVEVIGGDLLMKRAHQNSASIHPELAPAQGGLPGQSQVSGAQQLVTMSGDLAVAQDYENYLNNREAINALIAANPESAFAAGWIATFARVNDLGLNHTNASDFLGGLAGWLDSVNKAGLGAVAADASLKHGSGGTVTVDIKVPNGTEVPGALSVFADALSQHSDASGTTVEFSLGAALAAGAYHGPASEFVSSQTGFWQVTGGTGNNVWFGRHDYHNDYRDDNAGQSHDILVGGNAGDFIHAGNGFDFVDGGAGDDLLYGGQGNDILVGGRGNDVLYGGQDNDTYVFNRGDGPDWVVDDGGSDTLLFGPGIGIADVSVSFSNTNNLIVAVKDPAHPGAPVTDYITLQGWALANNRIEYFRFADGSAMDIGPSFGTWTVPFGASFSGRTVMENSPNGAVVGTVAGFDLLDGANLTYSLVNPDGRFAINASTGAVTVAASLLLDFESWRSHDITVRTADAAGHTFDKTFTIGVTDVFEAPSGVTLSNSSVAENSAGGTAVGTATGIDNDPHAVLSYALVNDAGGRFAINASTGAITVANGALLDYEAAASHAITVRALDQFSHAFDKPFTIAVTDVPETTGGPGDDHLYGTALADVMDGGAGNDVLTGGAGSDRFIFRPGSGADIITDFAAGAGTDDKLDLTAFANSFSLGVVLAHTTQSGADTVINFGGGDTITLQNVAKASLSGSDFVGMEAFTYGGIWTPAGSGSDNTWHVGDFNGDGKDDIFRYLNDSGEQVFVSTGSGFAYSSVWSGAGNGSDGKWHVGDFNGDGKDDAFRFIAGSGDQMFLSSGSVFYWNGVWTPAGAGSDGTWHVGDFNGDGKDDVFRYLGGEDVFLSNGSSFGNESMWSTAGAGSDGKWYIGDFNGDGKDDLFRALGGTGNQVFLSTGSNFVYGGLWTPASVGTDGTWHVGDFNGDGKDDIFRYLAGQSGADVFLSNGSTFVYDTSWTGAGIGVDNQWYVGDFNGGGADDIFRYLDGVGMFPSAFG